MTRRFPIPGDEVVKYFFPYIYMGDGDYFYVVTPLGSFRVNQSFDSFAIKLGVSIAIGVLAGALMWQYLNRRVKKESVNGVIKDKPSQPVPSNSKESTDFVEMVRKRWSEADTVVKKDFGRLSASISVMKSDRKEEKSMYHMSVNVKRSKGLIFEKLSKVDECRAVLKSLYSALGSCEQTAAVLDVNTPDAMVDEIKASSPILFGVLRAVNQSVIMPAIFHLNLEMLKSPMPVLDIPGPESWLVEIDISSSCIIVRHLRWARSTSDTNSKDYFEFRWVLTLSLDVYARNLMSCDLSVVDFKRGKNMSDVDTERFSSLLDYKHDSS